MQKSAVTDDMKSPLERIVFIVFQAPMSDLAPANRQGTVDFFSKRSQYIISCISRAAFRVSKCTRPAHREKMSKRKSSQMRSTMSAVSGQIGKKSPTLS